MKKDMKGIIFMVLGFQSLSTGGYVLAELYLGLSEWSLDEEFLASSFGRLLLMVGIGGTVIGIILLLIGIKLYIEGGREDQARKLEYWNPSHKGDARAGQYWYPDAPRNPQYYPPPPPPPDDENYDLYRYDR